MIRGGSPDNILSDFISHLLVHGGWLVDENNQPTVDTPEFRAAMEDYLALYETGSTLDKDDIVASVSGGETALAQIWPGWYVPTADGPADYTVIPTKLEENSEPREAAALQGVDVYKRQSQGNGMISIPLYFLGGGMSVEQMGQ